MTLAATTAMNAQMIAADLPGGRLELAWEPGGHVFMTGPAEEVFEGTWWGG